MILIPHDMHTWDAGDIQKWLSQAAADPEVSAAELRLARQAAAHAAAHLSRS
ncbi:hypothetical protein [Streptomyces sp. NPDC051909]|uniref:hypothetical protein n=1 Tax=Streptomyces sp. NPDC051909 TaxID=3154944 RepID=UPI003416085C